MKTIEEVMEFLKPYGLDQQFKQDIERALAIDGECFIDTRTGKIVPDPRIAESEIQERLKEITRQLETDDAEHKVREAELAAEDPPQNRAERRAAKFRRKRRPVGFSWFSPDCKQPH